MSNDRKKTKILIIDDESICVDSVEMMLIGTDYELISASSGLEGISVFKENPDVSIVLLDIMMADINGLEVLKIIKSDDILKKVPIILQTGCYGNSIVSEALSLGAISCLYKPFKKDTLINTLEETLAVY